MNFSKNIIGTSLIFGSFLIGNYALAKQPIQLNSQARQSIVQNSSDRVQIQQLFDSIYSAVKREDLSNYLSFFEYENYEIYQQDRQTSQWLFDRYDLELTVNKIDIVKLDRDRAEVRTIVTYKKIRGPQYRDNQQTALFFLRKVDGRWKVYAAKIERVDFI